MSMTTYSVIWVIRSYIFNIFGMSSHTGTNLYQNTVFEKNIPSAVHNTSVYFVHFCIVCCILYLTHRNISNIIIRYINQ